MSCLTFGRANVNKFRLFSPLYIAIWIKQILHILYNTCYKNTLYVSNLQNILWFKLMSTLSFKLYSTDIFKVNHSKWPFIIQRFQNLMIQSLYHFLVLLSCKQKSSQQIALQKCSSKESFASKQAQEVPLLIGIFTRLYQWFINIYQNPIFCIHYIIETFGLLYKW